MGDAHCLIPGRRLQYHGVLHSTAAGVADHAVRLMVCRIFLMTRDTMDLISRSFARAGVPDLYASTCPGNCVRYCTHIFPFYPLTHG
jgi:hypothetical protein